MKNVLSLFLAACLLFALGSCTKDAPNQGGSNPFHIPGGSVDPNIDPDPEPNP